jgi:acetamidase/formamidase
MAEAQISHKFHSHVHLKWNNALKPVLTVDSGSEITFDLADGGCNQFTADSAKDDVLNFDMALGDPAMGPVFVNGAEVRIPIASLSHVSQP